MKDIEEPEIVRHLNNRRMMGKLRDIVIIPMENIRGLSKDNNDSSYSKISKK